MHVDALVAALLTGLLAYRVSVQASRYFDELAVTSAVSSTLPASWTRSSDSALHNEYVHLDETSVRHAMAPPFPALWMHATGGGPSSTTFCPALLHHSFSPIRARSRC